MVRERLGSGMGACPPTSLANSLSSNINHDIPISLHSSLSLHSSPVSFPGFLTGLLGSPVLRHCSPLGVSGIPTTGLHPALAASLLFPPHPLLHHGSLPPTSMPSVTSFNQQLFTPTPTISCRTPPKIIHNNNNASPILNLTGLNDTSSVLSSVNSCNDSSLTPIKVSSSPCNSPRERPPSNPRW